MLCKLVNNGNIKPVNKKCVDRIKAIFHSLSSAEKRYLNSYLTAFHTKGRNRALELIGLLEKNPDLTQAEMADALYGDPRSKAFIMLKGRLLDKMLETLSLSINFQNNPDFKEDPPAFESIELQKNIIYALLLRRRGLGYIAADLLAKCAKRAEALALPELQLTALLHLRSLSAESADGQMGYAEDIHQALAQYETDICGTEALDEFRALSRHYNAYDEHFNQFLREKTRMLEQRLDMHYSLRAHYYYLTLKVQLHEGESQVPQAREALEELIDLVNTHEGLRTRNRLGVPYLRLAGLELHNHDYQAAMAAATQARSLLPARKTNYFNASLYAIFASFYAGDLAGAQEILDQLAWYRKQTHRTQARDFIAYLSSCLCYLRGEPDAAFEVLGDVNELFADKGGWNIGLRLHELLLLLDREQFDLAASRLETLRKHVARYEPSPRAELIYRYLHLLEKQSFDFSSLPPEMEEIVRALREDHAWDPVSSEVIRFEVWLQSRRTGQPFYPLLLQTLAAELPRKS